MEQEAKKLCFLRDKFIKIDDKIIAIETIKNQGTKYNLEQRVQKFKVNQLIINKNQYNLKTIHFSCFERIENQLQNLI